MEFKFKLFKLFIAFILGFIVGVFISNYNYDIKEKELLKEIKSNQSDIKLMERQLRDSESEISYWGQKYEECK